MYVFQMYRITHVMAQALSTNVRAVHSSRTRNSSTRVTSGSGRAGPAGRPKPAIFEGRPYQMNVHCMKTKAMQMLK